MNRKNTTDLLSRTVSALLVVGAVASTADAATAAGKGYVELFRHDAYGGSIRTIDFRSNVSDFKQAKWDRAKDDMNDEVSSFRYVVPAGWELQLCSDKDYGIVLYALRGSGELAKLHNLNDMISSARWVRLPD